VLQGHTDRLGRVAFHPMGRHLATASFDTTWRLWDCETGACLLEQEGHSRAVYAVAFQQDGALAGSVGLDALGAPPPLLVAMVATVVLLGRAGASSSRTAPCTARTTSYPLPAPPRHWVGFLVPHHHPLAAARLLAPPAQTGTATTHPPDINQRVSLACPHPFNPSRPAAKARPTAAPPPQAASGTAAPAAASSPCRGT
jgi:hypothetical protein